MKLTDRPQVKLFYGGTWTEELLLGRPMYEREVGVGPVMGTVIETEPGDKGGVVATIALTEEGCIMETIRDAKVRKASSNF